MNGREFVELFNRIKTEEKGRKAVVRGLSDKDNRELKKILKRGYTKEDIEGAIKQMFLDPSQWAISTGNDIPTHFLRQDNFERYFNSFLNFKEIEEKKEEKKIQEKKQGFRVDKKEAERLFIENSKQKYLKSIECGEWLGDIYEANAIGKEFAGDFSKRFKSLLFRKSTLINKRESKNKNHLDIEKRVELLGRSPEGIFCLEIVKRAVKKKIVKSW